MNQGQVIDTNVEGESSFNFTKWIIDNDLTEIRDLFIKHGATKRWLLTITSSEFQSLLKDEELQQKPHLFPVVMNALTTITVDAYRKIVVYAEEQEVIENMTNNIKTLDDICRTINNLKSKYRNTITAIKQQKLKQVNETRNKINKLFAEINNAMEIKKQMLLKTLQNIENENVDKKLEGIDENKENDIFSIAMQKLDNEKEFLVNKVNKCTIMIETSSKNKNIKQRKNKIITIGKITTDNFNKIQNELTDNVTMIKNMINKNETDIVNIDYIVNENKYNNILNEINTFGDIINKQHSINDTKQKQSIKDLKINAKNNKTDKLMTQLVSKSNQITKQQQIINDLNKTLGQTVTWNGNTNSNTNTNTNNNNSNGFPWNSTNSSNTSEWNNKTNNNNNTSAFSWDSKNKNENNNKANNNNTSFTNNNIKNNNTDNNTTNTSWTSNSNTNNNWTANAKPNNNSTFSMNNNNNKDNNNNHSGFTFAPTADVNNTNSTVNNNGNGFFNQKKGRPVFRATRRLHR